VPQVVVLGDDFGGWHDFGGHVGDIAFEPDEGLGSGQGGFVQVAVGASGFDESC
jgi:hypothetical protein